MKRSSTLDSSSPMCFQTGQQPCENAAIRDSCCRGTVIFQKRASPSFRARQRRGACQMGLQSSVAAGAMFGLCTSASPACGRPRQLPRTTQRPPRPLPPGVWLRHPHCEHAELAPSRSTLNKSFSAASVHQRLKVEACGAAQTQGGAAAAEGGWAVPHRPRLTATPSGRAPWHFP